jgi:hypothetical protein
MPLVKPGSYDSQPSSSDHDGKSTRKNAAKKEAEKFDEFKVLFFGGSGFQDDKEEKLRRFAHEELYRERMGKAPSGEASNADLRREIEKAAGQRVDIHIVVVRIGDQDRAGSFINHLGDLGKFLKESRGRFLTDAIKELKNLGDLKSEYGDDISKDKFQLCRALLKAQQPDEQCDAFFDSDHEAALDTLRNSPDLKYVFRSAEGALLKARTGKDAIGNPEARLRDKGKADDRDRDREGFDR